jgi:hydroxymethylbilane synthase
MRAVRTATRGSELALWQARHVAQRVEALLDVATEIVPLKTSGDRLRDVPLAELGGKGLFVKEIEEALLEGRADLAVHSAKDLPALQRPELVLAAFPERADPRDALVAREPGATLAGLRRGARVGTGSVRRAAQLRRARPDLEVVPLRGNVPTRLRRLDAEGLDAVVLACAGLERLGLAARIAERIAPEAVLPAVAQGALAVQARRDDPLAARLAALDHAPSARRVAAERSFLEGVGGDCNVPLAALAEPVAGGRLRLRALVIDPDGRREARADLETPVELAEQAGAEAARRVRATGGEAILAGLRGEGGA